MDLNFVECNTVYSNKYISTVESKKLSKQEQRQSRGYGECFDGCQMGGRFGGMGEEVRGEEVQIGSYRIAVGMSSTL